MKALLHLRRRFASHQIVQISKIFFLLKEGFMARPNQRNGRGDGRGEDYSKRRRSVGGDQVEGRQSVKELVFANRRSVEQIWIEETVVRKGIVNEIIEKSVNRRIPVHTVSTRRFESAVRSEGSQGVIAFCAALREVELSELVTSKTNPFLLVIDGITDPRNLGAILRSGELAGVTGVVLPSHRSAMVTPSATKAAAGAIEYLDFSLVPGVPSALMELQKLNVLCVGLDLNGTSTIYDLPKFEETPVALVLGAEDKGMSRLTAERCDLIAKIPQFGRLDSLNISVAASIAMFEIARSRVK